MYMKQLCTNTWNELASSFKIEDMKQAFATHGSVSSAQGTTVLSHSPLAVSPKICKVLSRSVKDSVRWIRIEGGCRSVSPKNQRIQKVLVFWGSKIRNIQKHLQKHL